MTAKKATKKLTKKLGRKPTDDEVAKYVKKMNKKAAAKGGESATAVPPKPNKKAKSSTNLKQELDKGSGKLPMTAKKATKKLTKKLGRTPTDDEVAKYVKKMNKKAAAIGGENATAVPPKPSQKTEQGGDVLDGVGARLDWSKVRFKGKQADESKNKFLRLMGGGSRSKDTGGSAAGQAKAGGVVASLMNRVAKKQDTFGMFSGKSKSAGSSVDVNSGSRAIHDLAAQFDQGQALLKMKHQGGGKVGFSC